MATKREIMVQLTPEVLKLVADAADAGVKAAPDTFGRKNTAKIKSAAKLLRTVRAAK